MRQYEAQPVRRHALAPSVGGEDLADLGGLPHIEAGPRNVKLGEAAEGEGVAGRGDGAGRGGAAAVVAGRPAGNGGRARGVRASWEPSSEPHAHGHTFREISITG